MYPDTPMTATEVQARYKEVNQQFKIVIENLELEIAKQIAPIILERLKTFIKEDELK